MNVSFIDRFRSAWNVFRDKTPHEANMVYNPVYSRRPDRTPYFNHSTQSMISSIYNKIAIDVACLSFVHAKLRADGSKAFDHAIDSNLNRCLTVEANIDQTSFDFWLDVTESLLSEGCVAISPVDTDTDPDRTGSYNVKSLRVGKVIGWHPYEVEVRLYNEDLMMFQDITVSKSYAAIITNPFYSVMNEPNSTLQRLLHKLTLLDYVDEQSGSGKLDLIVQLPYVVKSETRKREAETKRKEIETQLSGSKYGVAYIDATDRITQLNRPLENNLVASVDSLTNRLHNELRMPQSIFDGTATEDQIALYYNSTVVPIAIAITAEMSRKFLTPTARTQNQAITFIYDPLKFITIEKLGDLADKLIRNQVVSANEIRVKIGLRPNGDPSSDKLENPNMPHEEKDIINEEDAAAPSPPGLSEFIDSL